MSAKLEVERWRLPPPPDGHHISRFVDHIGNADDYHVVLLAAMGMNYKTIAAQTGLTAGQIAYRLGKINKRLEPKERLTAYNYRNGTSAAAKAVIKYSSNKVAGIINPPIRRALAVIDV